MRRAWPSRQEHAREIGADHLVPHGFLEFEQRRPPLDSRIVDENVDRADLRLDLPDAR
jgi:hypothetical protein